MAARPEQFGSCRCNSWDSIRAWGSAVPGLAPLRYRHRCLRQPGRVRRVVVGCATAQGGALRLLPWCSALRGDSAPEDLPSGRGGEGSRRPGPRPLAKGTTSATGCPCPQCPRVHGSDPPAGAHSRTADPQAARQRGGSQLASPRAHPALLRAAPLQPWLIAQPRP